MGFLTGARAKQLVSAIKRLPHALASLRNVLRDVFETDEGVGQASLPEDEENEEDEQEVLLSFLNHNTNPGMDDHKDVVFNPIVLYQMRMAKDELRRERAREVMRLAGLDPNDVENADALANAKGHRSALAFLIANGARFTPVADENAEARARKERRRQLKNIEVYLTKQLDIETKKPEARSRHSLKRVGITVRKETALDVALETRTSPRIGRIIRQLDIAKAARSQLKFIQRVRPLPIQIQQENDALEQQEIVDDDSNSQIIGAFRNRAQNVRITNMQSSLDELRREFADEFADMGESLQEFEEENDVAA